MTISSDHLDSHALWGVLDVVRQLGESVDLDTMFGRVVEAALAVLHADRGTVFLYDPERHELYSKVATGAGEIRFSADRGIAGECARKRALLNIGDCYSDPRFNPEVDRQTGYRTRCLLTVPLIGLHGELVGVLQLLNKHEGVFNRRDERIASALAAQCAVALQRANLLEQYLLKQRMERDLALARRIQQGVLPQRMPQVPGYELAGWSRPADQTGGDIYDAIQLDERHVLLALFDATGHGIGPALSVTQVRAMVRMAARLGSDLDAMFDQINRQLVEDLAADRFVTGLIGILDAERNELRYHAGGQGPLLHYRAVDDRWVRYGASAMPLGISADGAPEAPPPIEMGPGDLLALVSDGLFEQRNAANEAFGVDRIEAHLRDRFDGMPGDAIASLDERIGEFAGERDQEDDMTAVLIRRGE